MAEISQEMKMMTWILFEEARNNDPSVSIPGTRHFISHLINVFTVAEITEYNKVLDECAAQCHRALYEYSEKGNWGQASVMCWPIMDKIGFLAFDKRFSNPRIKKGYKESDGAGVAVK
jgi:hypothetical protein